VADERGFAGASECDQGQDVEGGILPGGVETGELVVSTY
jgi:hypothetical protein